MDFEATCEKDDRKWKNEIIEFPVVLVERSSMRIIDEFREMVRPTEQPVLTSFCTKLTSITQDQVDAADDLQSTLTKFKAWMAKHGLQDAPSDVALPVTCGDWDLRTCLPSECKRKGLQVPSALQAWCNIKHVFETAMGSKAFGMDGMLKSLNMELIGHHHLGIDDARNIARIAMELAGNRGAVIEKTAKSKSKS